MVVVEGSQIVKQEQICLASYNDPPTDMVTTEEFTKQNEDSTETSSVKLSEVETDKDNMMDLKYDTNQMGNQMESDPVSVTGDIKNVKEEEEVESEKHQQTEPLNMTADLNEDIKNEHEM